MSTRAVAVIQPVPLSSQAERSFRSCPAASVARLPGLEKEMHKPFRVTKDLFRSTVNFRLAVKVLPVSWIHDRTQLFSHFGYLPVRCVTFPVL
jgi:hypothetical protein